MSYVERSGETVWYNTHRIVCVDSYFASVLTTEEMRRLGLRFIGVVKTASKKILVSYLSKLEFQERGNWGGLHHWTANGHNLYTFVWVDRDRRYFITNTSLLHHGRPYLRICICQIASIESQRFTTQLVVRLINIIVEGSIL